MMEMFLKILQKLAIPRPRKNTSFCLKVLSSCASQYHVPYIAIGNHLFFPPSVQEAISEDDNRTAEVDTNCEVSIGSDICEREQDDHVVRFQDLQEFEEPVVPLAAADDLPLPLEILEPPDQGS